MFCFYCLIHFYKRMKTSSHIVAFSILQIVIITLYLLFVRYDPTHAQRSKNSVIDGDKQIKDVYPLFQDVHVMIFIGFGFLMTFLKKYGLSAVSLNLICSALAIEVFTLVYGFFHLHCEDLKVGEDGVPVTIKFSSDECGSSWPFIDVDVGTLISADFATAAVLISFGVVLGITSPTQLVVMTILETIIFVVNEIIGRDYLGAVDAGDTIFVHLFGAYFGLTVSRVLYNPDHDNSSKLGSSYTSDLFSMVGTVFLWMFWPSFNGGAAASGDAQQRAIINTYYSLASCTITTVIISCLMSKNRRMSMEHLQNATLAGGVAVGACADLMLTPGGAVTVGALAGILSTCGFKYIQPFLLDKLKIHDTCGVNNLHGMPGLFGGLLSVLIAGIASSDVYDKFSSGDDSKSMDELFPSPPNQQATNQILAIIVTLAFAVVGGLVTGFIGKLTRLEEDDYYNDDTNIDDIDEKFAVPEEIICFLENKNGDKETSNLLQNGH